MAKLYLPTNDIIDGPWLLSAANLQSLHHVLEDIDQKISEAAEKQLQDEAQKGVKSGKYADMTEALAQRAKYHALQADRSNKKSKVF